MAKRKRKTKAESKQGFEYYNEIVGLILILLSIAGFGSFGVVGAFIKKCAIFMFGSWSILLLSLTLALGVCMIAKRGKVNYFSGRLIGAYALIIALLLFSHLNYINSSDIKPKEIITVTMNNMDTAFKTKSDLNTGGGMIGAVFSAIFVSMFAKEGTTIVIVAIVAFGLIMIFDITLTDIGRAIASPFKHIFSSSDDDEEEVVVSKNKRLLVDDDEEDDKPIDKRVVITSVEDLEPKKIEETPIKKMEVSNENEVYIKPPIELLDSNKNGKNKSVKQKTLEE